jgi:integrase
VGAVFLSKIPVNMMIRDGKYHYRRRIPTALIELFGRKEVSKSLHTTDAIRASRLKNQLDGQLENLFQACRYSSILPDIARAQLKTILAGNQPSVTTEESQPNAIIIAAPSKRRGKRLADAIEALSKEKEHSWSLKTRKEYTGVFKKLLSSLNDPWLQDLDRPILVVFRDALSKEGKNVKTVNKYLGILSTVLRHANRLKWMQGNPAEGLGLKDSRRPDEIRRAFTTGEIKIIFQALQRDKQGFYDKEKYERYWLPLLGIYSGARVNELAQLSINDIVVEEDIPSIAITSSGDDDKRIKSESSRRTIPLHKDLLTLGFLVYVNCIRQQGHTKLFPTLKPGPNGYQHYFNSHHFAGSDGWLRKQLPNLEKGGSFHLFRHAFATKLKNAEVEERLIEELMGHHLTSLSMNRYGKPYKADVRIKAINKIEYGLLPKVKEVSEVVFIEEQNQMQPQDFLTCGKARIRIYLDEKKTPVELLQYQRPDLHGYSPFHKEIEGFIED